MLLRSLSKASMVKAFPWMIGSTLMIGGALSAELVNQSNFNGFIVAGTTAVPQSSDSDFGPVQVLLAQYTTITPSDAYDILVLSSNGIDSELTIYPWADPTSPINISLNDFAATSMTTGPFDRNDTIADPIGIAIAGQSGGFGTILVYGPDETLEQTITLEDVATFQDITTGPFNLDNDDASDYVTFFYSLALTGTPLDAEYGQGYVYIYEGDGEWHFGDFPLGYPDQADYNNSYAVGEDPRGITLAQLTDNQDLASGFFDGYYEYDLIVSNYGDGTVSLLLGNGDNTFDTDRDGYTNSYDTTGAPYRGAAGHFNPGDYTITPTTIFRIADGTDSDQDFVIIDVDDPNTSPPSNSVDIFLNQSDGQYFTQLTPIGNGDPTGTSAPAIALGFISNASEGDDIMITTATGTKTLINYGQSHFLFDVNGQVVTGSNPTSIALADLNADGYLDALITNQDSYSWIALIQNIEAPTMTSKTGTVRAGLETKYNIYLSWSDSAIDVGGQAVDTFSLYRDGVLIASLDSDTFSGTYVDIGLSCGTYVYTLVAEAGSLSSAPSSLTVKTPKSRH